jgi:hypothetical protein
MPKLELLLEFQELIVPCYPPMIPSTLIDAIPNVSSWVHQLTAQPECMHLFLLGPPKSMWKFVIIGHSKIL